MVFMSHHSCKEMWFRCVYAQAAHAYINGSESSCCKIRVESWKDVRGRATLTVTKVTPHASKLIKRADSSWKTSEAAETCQNRSYKAQIVSWGSLYRFFMVWCQLCPPPPSPLNFSFSSCASSPRRSAAASSKSSSASPEDREPASSHRQTRGQKAASHLGLSGPAGPEHYRKLACFLTLVADPHVMPGKMSYRMSFFWTVQKNNVSYIASRGHLEFL